MTSPSNYPKYPMGRDLAKRLENLSSPDAKQISTINITRKERASIAFQKSRDRSKEQIDAFERGYAAAEWDFEMAQMFRQD